MVSDRRFASCRVALTYDRPVTHLPDPIAYHLVPRAAWEAAPIDEPFRPASLGTEGFVHLTHGMADLVDVANAFYRDDPRPHVVLTIALRWLTSPWRYDGDERYPHVYGPLDRAAITEDRPIDRGADGAFLPIERPDNRLRPDVPALLARLVDAGVAFVVVGSAGAALLGADIAPGDLDIAPDLDPANLGRLAGVLAALDARPRIGIPGWVTEEERAAYRPEAALESLDYDFDTALGDLDLIMRPLGPLPSDDLAYARLIGSARIVQVGGRAVPVAAPENLVASKLGSRRPKDLRVRDELERLAADHD
jgi:uncharacterized protein (DUF952 family)